MRLQAKIQSIGPAQHRLGRLAGVSRVPATRGVSLSAGGAGVPSRRVARAKGGRLAGAMLAIAVWALLIASSALASGGPPVWKQPPAAVIVHSTRVIIDVGLETEELATEWKVEYAPAENGQAPPVGSPAWTLADKGATGEKEGNNFDIYIGAPDPGERANAPHQSRHLTPNTSYFARFVADNRAGGAGGGEAVDLVPFKTLAVGKPEVPKLGRLEQEQTTFNGGELTDTSAAFSAKVETNGAQTEYRFEYAPSPGGPWVLFSPTSRGTVTVAEDYANVAATLTGLEPETTHYVRVRMIGDGENIQSKYFTGGEAGIAPGEHEFVTTLTAKPEAGRPEYRNVTADSAHLTAEVSPHGSETTWRLESATDAGGPWTPVVGGGGTITQEQAEAVPYKNVVLFGVSFLHLSASTGYFVRLVVESPKFGVLPPSESEHFVTSGAPSVSTFAVHALHGGSLRLLGAVNPNSLPTSLEQMISVVGASGSTFTLTFEGHTTNPITYHTLNSTEFPLTAEVIRQELEKLPGAPTVGIQGPAEGPYTIVFRGADEGVSVPPVEDGPPSGGSVVTVSTVQQGGEAYDTHYHFEYVSQKQFEAPGGEGGFAMAVSTPEVDAGSGDSSEIVGEDLPGLQAGETYRYRLAASNTAPGTSLVQGAEQVLTVPVPPSVGEPSACPNEVFRTGLSAGLPDCRAYEQVTPVDKEGATEPFHYRGGVASAVVVGEGGESVAFEEPVTSYGEGPGAGGSPYFFSRAQGSGWLMNAGAPQPEAGIYHFYPQLYSADLSQVAFVAEYATSVSGNSPDFEYKVGPAGGPYTLVASIPREDVSFSVAGEGWVAGNGDFSKLVLQTKDYNLLGEPTGTRSGEDLYEYTASGGLRELNVDEEGATIGSCGANVVRGEEDPGEGAGAGASSHADSSSHSISADGSRVFFEAAPGHECAGPKNLYMRVNGSETVDIGAYAFLGADKEGDKLLLKNGTGEVLGYNTETRATRSPSPAETTVAGELAVLSVPYQVDPEDALDRGGYTYFTGIVPGVPGGGKEPADPVGECRTGGCPSKQVWRYDAVEHVIQCVSCASSFDPEPQQESILDGIQGLPFLNGGLPDYTSASANGEFVFFTTTSALVRQDIDGEIPAELPNKGGEFESVGGLKSPSTDVYEWRADGVDGCGVAQGCLALLTDGRGGYINLFLGSADEGRDVFISTRSKLLPQDDDTAGDIYDVRIDGGLPGAPPRPTECEGDACSTPPSAPNDPTPSSLTFSGVGNLLPAEAQQPSTTKPKATKPKAKKKAAKKKAGAKKKRKKGKGKRAAVGHAKRADNKRRVQS